MFARAAAENATIQAAMDQVIFYKINAEGPEGLIVAEKYGVRAYPTFIALNGAGEVTDRWIGYAGPEVWSQTARDAAAHPGTIAEKKSAYAEQPTLQLAKSLANDASTGYDFATAVGFLNKARELDPDHAGEYTDGIMMNMYYGSQSGAFTFDEVEAEVKQGLAAPDISLDHQFDLTMMLRGIAQNNETPERAVPYITAALKASEGSQDEGIQRGRAELLVDYALFVEKDNTKALGLYRAIMPEGWQEDAGQLNRFAWWCFEHDVNLEEANTLALKGLELADSDAVRSNILDTAAEICHRLGQNDRAVAHMQRAVELNPKQAYFQEQLARFEKAAAAASDG